MSAQGWTPGGRLGARDAAHADMLTAASHSHIKVTIKDDTLGLGARLGRENEQTGLDAFKGLLGRLNGKSEVELKEDQRKRDDVKLARYVALKFPEVRFVRGGLLAQEKIERLPVPKPQDNQKGNKSDGNDSESDEDDTSSDSSASAQKSTKRKSKSKSKTESKSKSKSKSKSESKSKSKSSKKSRSRADSDEGDDSSSLSESKKKQKSKKRKADTDEPSTASETKTAASVSRERRPMGRQLFRSRHIAQKKRALMDDKSLNEVRFPDFPSLFVSWPYTKQEQIFMVKSKA